MDTGRTGLSLGLHVSVIMNSHIEGLVTNYGEEGHKTGGGGGGGGT